MMRNEEIVLKEMYAEHCMESGSVMTPEGFVEFVEWRKNVDKYFENNPDSSCQILPHMVA